VLHLAHRFLVLRTPEHTFDIHVLRTFTRDLNGWIVRLQSTSPDASETINQVIYALNHTFREVELSYRVWRNERVQSILQHGNCYFFLLPLIRAGMKPTLPHVQVSITPEPAFKQPFGAVSEADLRRRSRPSTLPSSSQGL
jgi:hypothetical protein